MNGHGTRHPANIVDDYIHRIAAQRTEPADSENARAICKRHRIARGETLDACMVRGCFTQLCRFAAQERIGEKERCYRRATVVLHHSSSVSSLSTRQPCSVHAGSI